MASGVVSAGSQARHKKIAETSFRRSVRRCLLQALGETGRPLRPTATCQRTTNRVDMHPCNDQHRISTGPVSVRTDTLPFGASNSARARNPRRWLRTTRRWQDPEHVGLNSPPEAATPTELQH